MNNINVENYKQMLLYGTEILAKQVETINALNVFPVPDGDTGTNMNMTMQAGAKSLTTKNCQTIEEIAKTFSKGLLMGARGNSGVILSQFFRGLSEGMKTLDNEMSVSQFQKALKQGKVRAYNSVINAVEGTILTVIKDLAAYKSKETDFIAYFEELIKVGDESLANTPNLLPVLKEVGVVDSGGYGLMQIFHGMKASLNGEEIEITTDFDVFLQTEEHPMNIEDITFGYCTEMLIRANKEFDIKEIIAYLETVGDSIVAIDDEDIIKIHVHTENPIEVFNYGSTFGDFIHIKSENMRIQAEEAHGNQEQKEMGIVAVAPSEEMANLFKEIQDVEIISGGQTLNPSTEDIIKAIKATNAKNVLVFPNNSNIIMTAESAQTLIEDVNVEVVKTKYMTQALECLISYDEELTLKDNKDIMEEKFDKIINFEITKAIKDTTLNGVTVTENDYLIVKNGKLIASEQNINEALNKVSEDFKAEELEIVNVLIGADGKEEELEQFEKELEEHNAFLDIQKYQTNQPIYNYLISGIIEED